MHKLIYRPEIKNNLGDLLLGDKKRLKMSINFIYLKILLNRIYYFNV